MRDPSALTEEDIDEMVHSIEQPGGTRAILEMSRARQTDADRTARIAPTRAAARSWPSARWPISGTQSPNSSPRWPRDVRGVVIPASCHNIALENPAALAQAYLDFFAGG